MIKVLVFSWVFLGWTCLAGFPPLNLCLSLPEAAEARGWRGSPESGAAEAARTSSPPGAPEQGAPDLFRASVQVLVALIGVLACLGAGLVVVRRYMGNSGVAGRGSCVHVLATGYIGHRKGIYIVDVAGHILVLGVTPAGITFLTSLEDREAVERFVNRRERLPRVPFITQYLERLCRKGSLGDASARASSAIREQAERL